MMNRSIIFFDIDGTIFMPGPKRISAPVRQSIAEAQRRGHLCFIASGRPWSFIAENVRELGFDGYVLANGAHIKYQGKDLKVRYLNYDLVKELCGQLHKKGIEYILSTPELSYIRRSSGRLLEFFAKCNIDFENLVYDYDEDEIFRRTLKLEVWAASQDEADYIERCCTKFASEVHGPGQTTEIYGKTVSKATGILDVLEMVHLPRNDSYCFGDGPNDVEMFQTVGHGFAMGNGVDAVKEIAQEICLPVEQDGVAVKLGELFEAGVL